MVKVIELDSFTKKTVVQLHNEIYTKINQQYIDVFLCGGASNQKYISIRDRIKDKMRRFKDIRILYPEDLFIEMLNKNKEYDLLSLERFLADNCDIICIVCESAGSLVELGAFTNNDNTVNKVIAVIEEKRVNDRSFIMLGPIKILKKINKNNVIFYNEDKIDRLNNDLIKAFTINKIKQLKMNNDNLINNKSLNSIIGLYYFIPLVLYFYKVMNAFSITNILKYLFQLNNYHLEEFDTIFRSSLKLLYKDKYVIKNISKGKTIYSLTEKGYKNTHNVLSTVDIKNRTVLYDHIRFGIIKEKYYI